MYFCTTLSLVDACASGAEERTEFGTFSYGSFTFPFLFCKINFKDPGQKRLLSDLHCGCPMQSTERVAQFAWVPRSE